MTVEMKKGGNIGLRLQVPGLKEVLCCLGWEVKSEGDTVFDLDASAFILNSHGIVISDKHFVFYNNLVSPDGTVRHTGSNSNSKGKGDKEVFHIKLKDLPKEADKIVLAVTIYHGGQRRQYFSQVKSAYIRIVNNDDGVEIARYDISEKMKSETAVIFGEIYRKRGDWWFTAVGEGYDGGLRPIAKKYGVSV